MHKVKLIALLLVLVLGIYYFSQKGDEFSRLSSLTLAQLCAASVVIMSYHLVNGGKFKILLSVFPLKLSIKEWFGLPQVTILFNLLFFKSGTVSCAYYLKKNHRLSYSQFIVAMTAQKLLGLFAVAVLGLGFSLFLFIFYEISIYVILILSLVLAGLLYLFFFASAKHIHAESSVLKKIIKILELWDKYRQNKSAIFKFILFEIVSIMLLGMRYYVVFSILNAPISYFESIVISLIVSTLGFVSVVPGNIGIRETIVGMSAYFMEYNFDYGIIATTLDRVIATSWVAILGFIYFHLLHLKGYSKEEQIRF